jgi:hypothetical protein
MDANQLSAALAAHAHRRDLGSLSAPGLGRDPGAAQSLDPKTLKKRDDYRAPRVAYDDLFESWDELAS